MPQIQRWYKGFSYTGKPQQLVDEVSRLVQQHYLSNFVPLLRVQKGAKKGRFYFFIAIESSQIGSVPPEVESVLLKLSFFQYPIKDSPGFIYEQIKSMVGAAHDVYEYTNNIPYQIVDEFVYDNPFDLIESASIKNVAININTISRQYDQLLYWLSALGSGTWESFKKGCEVLQLQDSKRILRRFRLLGHIESSLDGKRWSIAPGTIVKIHSQNSQEFILCGQRCTSWLTQLKEYAEIISLDQPTANAPPCIRLKVNEYKIITEHFSIIDAGDVSSQLADILPDITGWQQSLRSIPGIVPSLYEWKQFDGNDFVEHTFHNETGMYQMWDRKCGDFYRMTLFYDTETDTWRQGDWYGLRFLAMHYSDRSLMAYYDATTARLAIPFSQRWPELYERALVLASGLLPTYHKTEQHLWLIYENIAANLVEKLTKKLCVTCEEDFSGA
ncbi:hypothetical protein FACHB389_19905 [Nostoc calcicola FACHB-389]|nr:hypothetical protein [Nostoc calcicola FACHB-3891]OKH32420.1 hypothetical protein FACHB389_19905 [Nostoc calcicola FACHB-389]